MDYIKNEELKECWFEELRGELSCSKIPYSEEQKFKNKLFGLSLDKGEHLVREGDTADTIAFIVKGIFRAYYLTDSGDEKTIVFRNKGKVLSAYSSYLEEKPAKFSIQALEPSLLLNITIKDFETLQSENPVWNQMTSDYYMNLFIEKEARERELMSHDAKARYTQFLNDYPGLVNRITHYHIASYLGISNVTLSRIRNGKI